MGRFSPLTYSRDVRVSPHDPRVLYACLSPAARSEDGSLYRSRTWADVGALRPRRQGGEHDDGGGPHPRTPTRSTARAAPARSSGPWTVARRGKNTGCPPPSRTSTRSRAARAMIRAHLLRWRPRPGAQRRETTPRARPSGAASQLDPSRRSPFVRQAPRAMIRAHLLRWRPRPGAQRRETTPRARPSGAASQLDPSHRSSRFLRQAPRAMIRAHLLRWRPRPDAQRRSTPRARPSGAASQLDPSHRSSRFSPTFLDPTGS